MRKGKFLNVIALALALGATGAVQAEEMEMDKMDMKKMHMDMHKDMDEDMELISGNVPFVLANIPFAESAFYATGVAPGSNLGTSVSFGGFFDGGGVFSGGVGMGYDMGTQIFNLNVSLMGQYMVVNKSRWATGIELQAGAWILPMPVFNTWNIAPAWAFWYAPFKSRAVLIGAAVGVNIVFPQSGNVNFNLNTSGLRLAFTF